LDAFAVGQSICGGFRNSLASSFRNQVALLDLTRQYHSCTARFAIVLRYQLTQLLLVFAARERRGEIFTASVALYVQPMPEPYSPPGVIGPKRAMPLQRLLFSLAAKHRHTDRPSLDRPCQAFNLGGHRRKLALGDHGARSG